MIENDSKKTLQLEQEQYRRIAGARVSTELTLVKLLLYVFLCKTGFSSECRLYIQLKEF